MQEVSNKKLHHYAKQNTKTLIEKPNFKPAKAGPDHIEKIFSVNLRWIFQRPKFGPTFCLLNFGAAKSSEDLR